MSKNTRLLDSIEAVFDSLQSPEERKAYILSFLGALSLENERLREVVQSKEDEIKKLEEESLLDELTGLYSRKGFVTLIRPELELFCSETYGNRPLDTTDFVIIRADLDGLSDINNKFGHDTGDEALKDVAHVLLLSATTRGKVARFGNKADEFVIVLWLKDEDPDEQIELFKTKVLEHITTLKLQLSVSLGCVMLSEDKDVDLSMKKADDRMYAHKVQNYADRGIVYNAKRK